MKKIILISIFLCYSVLLSAEYHTEYINVDDMVKGYCEELLNQCWENAPSNMDAIFRFTQNGNAITLEYTAYGISQRKHSDNLYKDLETLLETSVTEIKSRLIAVQAEEEKQTRLKELEYKKEIEAQNNAIAQKQEEIKEQEALKEATLPIYGTTSITPNLAGDKIGKKKTFNDGSCGIVFYLTSDGKHGAVVSITEMELRWESVRKRGGA